MATTYKTFGSETLYAADVNSYLMRQAVIECANTTARDAIPAPHEGMCVWLDDKDILQVYTGAGWVTFGGDTDWTALTCASGWHADATNPPMYRVKNGQMMFTGLAVRDSGSPSINEAFINLPVATWTMDVAGTVRPFPTISETNVVVCRVLSSTIIYRNGTYSNWISLDSAPLTPVTPA